MSSLFTDYTTTISNVLGGGFNSLSPSPLNKSSNTALNSPFYKNPDYLFTISFTNPRTDQPDSVTGLMPESFALNLDASYVQPLESIGHALSDMAPIAKAFGHKIGANIFSIKTWEGNTHSSFEVTLRFVAMEDTYKDVIEPIQKLAYLVVPTVDKASSNPGGLVQLGFITAPGPVIGLAEGTTPQSVFGDVIGAVSDGAIKVTDSVATTAKNTVLTVGDGQKGSTINTAVTGTASTMGASLDALSTTISQALKSLVIKNNISIVVGRFTKIRSVVVENVNTTVKMRMDKDGNIVDADVSLTLSSLLSPTDDDVPYMFGYNTSKDKGLMTPAKPAKSAKDILNIKGAGATPVGSTDVKVSTAPVKTTVAKELEF